MLGAIDVLVNNAGTATIGGVLEPRDADWERVLRTNLDAPLWLSTIGGRSMAARRRGKIINIASEHALFGAAALPA